MPNQKDALPRSGSTQTDEQLATAIQAGQIAIFGELVERYEQKLIRYAKRFLFGYEDSQDMVQDVLLKAYANLNSFDTNRKFSSWLYRIAHNEFINAIKKKGREPLSFFDPDTLFPHPTDPHQADTELNRQELKNIIEQGLNQLDAKYREPLVLFYFEDLDYQAIAEIMHIPVSTVGVRIKRAKETLQKLITP